MGAVEGDPVALATADQRPTGGGDLRVVGGKILGRLLQHDLANVRRVHRRPANSFEPEVGPAVLRLGAIGRTDAEALVAEARGGDADAVKIAGGKTRGASKADEQAVDIGAFAAELFGRQHRLDVPRTAAARRRDAFGVRDKPSVDRAGLGDVGRRSGDDSVRGFLDHAVGRNERGWPEIERPLFRSERSGSAAGCKRDRSAAGRDAVHDLGAAETGAGAPVAVVGKGERIGAGGERAAGKGGYRGCRFQEVATVEHGLPPPKDVGLMANRVRGYASALPNARAARTDRPTYPTSSSG